MKILIKGRVQGVGFRPFVFRLAKKYNLKGWVRNTTSGVEIDVSGDKTEIDDFLKELQQSPPRLSRIENIIKMDTTPNEIYEDFKIVFSDQDKDSFVMISPDLGICEDCEKELLDRDNRRYRYPLINCTNCGPRFTIIKDVPYDRKNTTMNEFKMCEDCNNEYENPLNRRFHAQPNACFVCGPSVKFLAVQENGKIEEVDASEYKNKEINESPQTCDALNLAVKFLNAGKIVAIKGIGGYHLACDAFNYGAVFALRKRKIREAKPFAIMVPDIGTARELCNISKQEEEILLSPEKPILLLKNRRERELSKKLSKHIAPGSPFLGIMLPYTPIHRLLFEGGPKALVMTSGNKSQEPIYFRDEEALRELSSIADGFLIHNRPIQRRCDDSVARVFDGKLTFMRRARGYAPEPIPLPFSVRPILGVGAELKGTFCFGKDSSAYLSHHLGDMENLETHKAFEEGIIDFQNLFDLKFDYIAYDKHPDYFTTRFALNQPKHITKIPVQHHHAHTAGCMAEHNLKGQVIGVIFDGTGFGDDGTIWGGEFLICDYVRHFRLAHFINFPLPGGEQAIKEPWRLGAWWIESLTFDFEAGNKNLNKNFILEKKIKDSDLKKWKQISRIIKKGHKFPLTSSAGRLFDSTSAILGICHQIDYEGQPAIELEYEAWKSSATEFIQIPILKKSEISILDPSNLLRFLIYESTNSREKSHIYDLARIFHNSIAHSILKTVMNIRDEFSINQVVLSGGCFQNLLLLEMAMNLLKETGFSVYTNHIIPPNDGSISLGQIAIANHILDGEFF